MNTKRGNLRNDVSERPATAPVLDTHAHLYRLNMPLTETAWHVPRKDATLEQFIETLDEAGVHFAVIAAASMYGDYNDYSMHAVRTEKRLRATLVVSPDIDPYALAQYARDGAVGIRLQFRNVVNPPDLTDFRYQRLFRRVADLGLHVQLHDEVDRLPNYIEAIENAGPKLVIDHFGRPRDISSNGFKAVLEAVQRGRTWVRVSAAFRLESRALAASASKSLLKYAGTDRLMWGSDWPFAAYEDSVTYKSVLDSHQDLFPDTSVRHQIDMTGLRFYFS